MKPSADEYIRLLKAAQAMRPAMTVEKQIAQQEIYDQAGFECRALLAAGWTIPELDEVILQELGRRVVRNG
jgi:hypothetical protein